MAVTGGGTTTTTTAPKTTTTVAKPAPAPTVYWFNGKAYYSITSYQNAVAAYNAAKAAAAAAAKAAAAKAAAVVPKPVATAPVATKPPLRTVDPVVAPKTTATAPKTWVFRGKTYTSLASYNSAVSAYNAAQKAAAAKAAAAEAARQATIQKNAVAARAAAQKAADAKAAAEKAEAARLLALKQQGAAQTAQAKIDAEKARAAAATAANQKAAALIAAQRAAEQKALADKIAADKLTAQRALAQAEADKAAAAEQLKQKQTAAAQLAIRRAEALADAAAAAARERILEEGRRQDELELKRRAAAMTKEQHELLALKRGETADRARSIANRQRLENANAASDRVRSILYDRLEDTIARERAQTANWIWRSKGGAERANEQQNLADRLYAADAPAEDVNTQVALAAQQRRREELIREAEKTGDWTKVMDSFLQPVKQTGGRYVDRRLEQLINDRLVKPVNQIRLDFAKLIELAQSYERTENWAALDRLVNDPKTIELQALFDKWYGDGTAEDPGAMDAYAQKLDEAQRLREKIWHDTLLTGRRVSAPGTVDSLVYQIGKEISEGNLGGATHERYHSWVDMPVYDPKTGIPTGETKREMVFGVDAFVAKQEEVERARVEAQQRNMAYVVATLKQRGMTNIRFSQGQLLWTDPRVEELRTQIDQWLPQWKMNARGVPVDIQAAIDAGDHALVEQLKHKFLADAQAAFAAANRPQGLDRFGSLMTPTTKQREGASFIDARDYDRMQQLWMSKVATLVGGTWDPLTWLSMTPLREIFDSALTIGAGVITLIRLDQAGFRLGESEEHRRAREAAATDPSAGFWSPEVTIEPEANFLANAKRGLIGIPIPGPSGMMLYFGATKGKGDGTENVEMNKQELAQFRLGWASEDVGVKLQALRDFGVGYVEGNLGWILEGMADPSLGIGFGTRPLRLAAAAERRAALAAKAATSGARTGPASSLTSFLSDFYSLSAPRFLGGAGPQVGKQEFALLQFARRYGGDYGHLAVTDPSDWHLLIEHAAKGDIQWIDKSSNAFSILAAGKKPEARTALLHIVEQEAPRIAKKLGINYADPFKYSKILTSLRESVTAAENIFKQEQLIKKQDAQNILDLAAAGLERGQRIKTVAEEAGLNPSIIDDHVKLMARGDQLSTSYLSRAQRGLETAELLMSGKYRDDPVMLRTLQKDLNDLVGQVRQFEDTYTFGPGSTRTIKRKGFITQHWEDVIQYRMDHTGQAGDINAPSFGDIKMAQTRQDIIAARKELNGLRAYARKLPPGKPLDPVKLARMRQLASVLRGLQSEVVVLTGGRLLVRRGIKRYGAEIRDAIRESSVAPLVTTKNGRAAAFAQDVHRAMVASGGKIRPLTNFSNVEKGALATMENMPPLHVLFGAPGQLWAEFHGLWSGGSVMDLWMALYHATDGGTNTITYGAQWQEINRRVIQYAKNAGMKGTDADIAMKIKKYFEERHVFHGVAGVTSETFRRVENDVHNLLLNLRNGRRRVGQVKVAEKRLQGADDAAGLSRADRNPVEYLAKAELLQRKYGWTVDQYDEARRMLMDPILRENTHKSLMRQARLRVAQTGESLGDALRPVRAERRQLEANRQFETFAMNEAWAGKPLSVVLEAYKARYLSDDLVATKPPPISAFQDATLKAAWLEKTGIDLADGDAVRRYLTREGTPDAAPLHDAGLMREWWQNHGYWSPRTGEQIASGAHVWSVTDERAFYKGMLNAEPDWLKEDILRPLVRDMRLLPTMLDYWGTYAGDFETKASADATIGRSLQDTLIWGLTDDAGRPLLKKQRTAAEARDWAYQRYGDLVAKKNKKGELVFHQMPQLMNIDEYKSWLKITLSPAGLRRHENDFLLVRDLLPESLVKQLFDGDFLSTAGMQLDQFLLGPKDVDFFASALEKAVLGRLDRLRKIAGEDRVEDVIGLNNWLAQEQLKFAYDVTSELLLNDSWRQILKTKTGLAGLALHTWAAFHRMVITFTIAFPVMNLIDSFGLKRVILTVFYNDFKVLGNDVDGIRMLPNARAGGIESGTVFQLAEISPLARVGDKTLPMRLRTTGLLLGLSEVPARASKFGEDNLRLAFARSMAGQQYRRGIRAGMDPAAAEILAKAEAKRQVEVFFASVGDNQFLQILNLLVPFFSYNFNVKKFALRAVFNHPAIWAWGDRVRRAIEEANREMWAEMFPNAEFPEGPQASHVWFMLDGELQTVDLSMFSDWSRSISAVTNNATAVDWFKEFIRIPSGSQSALLAMLTGGMTPWGKKGDWRELFPWVDLIYWMQGNDYKDELDKRSLLQMWSQILFFKKFGDLTPLIVERQTYFGMLSMGDKAAARKYLAEHEDLQIYFAQFPKKQNFNPEKRLGWRDMMTIGEQVEYDVALEKWEALSNTLDKEILRYSNQPWSQEYKDAKRRAFLAQMMFFKQNPILAEAWGAIMSPAEFAEFKSDWRVDQLADAWFGWKRPSRADFASDLAYQQALVADYANRENFLAANPLLRDRLYEGHSAIEDAWHDQELMWSEVLEFQAKLKLRILEEKELGEGANYDLISTLYDTMDLAGSLVDSKSYALLLSNLAMGGERGEWSARRVLGVSGADSSRLAMIPGFTDLQMARATPAERAEMVLDQRYAKGISDIADSATDGLDFYNKLFKDPWLTAEYWKRNPDKKAKYEANQQYINWIGSWAGYLKKGQFANADAVWNSMPSWVKDRYFAAHPDSGMRDGAGGGGGTAVQYNGQWFKSPESRDRYIKFQKFLAENPTAVEYKGQWFKSAESRDKYIKFVEGKSPDGKPSTAVQYKGIWFKSPESRDKYIQFVENGGSGGGGGTAVQYKGIWFKSPASRDKYIKFIENGGQGSGGGGTAVEYKGLWFKSTASRDKYIKFIENGGQGGSSSAVQYKGLWFKSAASRDKYIKFIENGVAPGAGSGAVQYNGIWFKSTASRDKYIKFIENDFADHAEEGAEGIPSGQPQQPDGPGPGGFVEGQQYFAAMGKWVELLKAKDFVAADTHFKAMPEWMKERYFGNHPDQRARLELDSNALRIGAEYFLATGDDKLRVLERSPEFAQWMAKNGGNEQAMRGLIIEMYRAIPSTEPWLKRTFRAAHPDIFSVEAAGQRRLEKVAQTLIDHPEMLPFYERALKLQSFLYTEQLKLPPPTPPKPIEIVRKSRARKKRRRRFARINSQWAMHQDLRLGR